MLVFAVETSCDETSICIINDNKKIFSHIIYSQKEHVKFGGVIPELASRAHLQILQKISNDAIKEAKINIDKIDLFCATCGPGLIGGLLIGSIFTKSLAIGLNKPFVPINHLEAHLLSTTYNNEMVYPYVSFLLTGGHTQIYLINGINNYELLGETVDDAIGEAFDKVAKLLNMKYPGGPEIEAIAKTGEPSSFKLPHPMQKKKDLNFSFSGIKTAVSLIVNKENKINSQFKSNMAACFQTTIASILESKFDILFNYLNAKKINISQISLVGGVASNQYIFNKLNKISKRYSCTVVLPAKFMLSDNAAMIGWTCIKKYKKNPHNDLYFKANPRLQINQIV